MASACASTRRTALITSVLCALATGAAAQGAPAPAPPPAQPSEDLPPPPPPPTYAEPGGGEICTPQCRSGYLCQAGQCVSACNPPCAAGEQCTAQGECVASGYGSAPSFPEPEEMGQPPPREGVEQHDGFMLRLAIGGGGGGAALDAVDSDVTLDLSGGGGAFSLDIGGSPTDDLVIHLRISDFVMFEPDAKIEGSGITASGELNGSFGSNFFGLGLTYYFMPINVYLTAALGAGWLTWDDDSSDDRDSRSTDAGFGFDFDLGKEWWVSDNWGLGVAGRFTLVNGTYTDEDTDEGLDFSLAAFSILFSATYQ